MVALSYIWKIYNSASTLNNVVAPNILPKNSVSRENQHLDMALLDKEEEPNET